jgi:23S rRNA pseudouridine1911/1915/1917 synthase
MLKVIFQNKDFIVVDKPAGMTVHSGVGTKEKTLVDFLLEKFPEIKNVGDAAPRTFRKADGARDPKLRPGIVHRLDKETSGVMIVARNQKSFEHLKNLFKNRKVEKKYLAIVYGRLKNKAREIEGQMGRSRKDFRKQVFVRGKIHPVESRKAGLAVPEFNRVNVRKERYSLTYYRVKKEFGDNSLIEVTPKTGRMHQIRVHFHSIGHPIVGDQKYTFKKYRNILTPRMLLHANSISFTSPDNIKYFFESPMPKEFKDFLKEKSLQ